MSIQGRMKRWLYKVIDELILTLFITGITGLLGILTVLPFQILVGIALTSLCCGVIGLILIKRKKRIICLIQPISSNIEIDWDRLGFSYYKKPDPLLIDDTHALVLVEQTYIIKGTDVQCILRYKGINMNKQVSRFFRDSVAGDSPMDALLMNIQAIDKARNTPLKWKLVKDSSYEKIIEIYFFEPLKQGEEFDIEWSCQWLGTFTRREDYVFYPVNIYKQGVKKLIARLVLERKPKYIELIRINNKGANLEPLRPQIKEEDKKFVITYEIDNPKFIYIVQFGRQDL